MKSTEAGYRHELKYVVSAAQIPLLRSRVAALMRPDPHAGERGMYTVRSLYFDDFDNRCYYENENGTSPREKLRIRIYDRSPAHIALECKRKEGDRTLKTSAALTRAQAEQAIAGSIPENMEALPPLLRKLKLQEDTRLLRPAVVVEYDRIAYLYRNGTVRITFDLNISSCAQWRRFWEQRIPKRPVMAEGMHLLEVKFDRYLPDYIYRSLNLGGLQRTAYSKYYLCRRYGMK